MPPITVLNVAEKPSVARALAGVFNRMPGSRERPMERRDAQIFTHENVCFPNVMNQGSGQPVNGPMQSHIMITTSVRGHLANQDFPDSYGWSKCPPSALFTAPIETTYNDDVQGLERMLRDLARRATVLILWLDCDREGEAISDEVRTVCFKGNLNLKVLRAKFSTVLPQEIQRALKTLGQVNEHFVQAVQARSQLDLRVGAAFTRFQTLRLQKKFDGFADKGVISYGPCQFPTLGFVVERWARIETFQPEDFWYIELASRVPTENNNNNNNNNNNARQRPIHFQWKRGRLHDRVLTMALYEDCLAAGEATVVSLTGRAKNKWRPVPLATVELQKRASRFLRISSETLMTAAEQLYQQGYISYPRTETEKFRPEFNHQQLIQEFTSIGGDFGAYATKLTMNNNFQRPRAGQHDDNAHPPITPAKAVDPQTIQDPTQRNIYVLITKHYLACCSRDAMGKETQLTVRMASEEFTAKGLMILEKNWLEIYAPWERWSTGQGELPPLQQGSRLTPSSLLLKEGRTAAPQPISEVELISLMDRNGIGTDATIATHIATILDREYATKDAALKFHPTKLGIALVEGYNSMGYQLNKPDLRREMEAECNDVALGRKTKDQIMQPILQKMKQCFDRANAEVRKLDEAVARHFPRLGATNDNSTVLQVNFSECGTCNTLMALKQASNNGNNNRNAFPQKLLYCGTCTLGFTLPRGRLVPMMEGNARVKCPICQYQVLKVLQGDGFTGNEHTVCPKCYSDPPMEHGGAQNGQFRCFQCQHPTCRLASRTQGGDVEVFKCPFCPQGQVFLKATTKGFILSCNAGQGNCSYCMWLPKEARSISIPENQTCSSCSTPGRLVRKVHFTWKPGSVPPHLGRECTVCVLCDTVFRQEMRVSLPQPGQVRTTNRSRGSNGRGRGGRGRGRAAPNRQGNGGGGGGGNTCYRCGQSGHFANNCPQNRNR